MTPQERALNFAATNAFQADEAFADARARDMELNTIGVEKSPICRPGADCWDIKLTFFDPNRKSEVAQRVTRYTVDVSDVVPVTVGQKRTWNIYL